MEIITEIKEVCNAIPVMEDRLTALKQAGFEDVNYRYLKSNNVLIPSPYGGLYEASHLPKKQVYRIQIGYTELKKGYSASWCLDVSDADVVYVKELPF